MANDPSRVSLLSLFSGTYDFNLEAFDILGLFHEPTLFFYSR